VSLPDSQVWAEALLAEFSTSVLGKARRASARCLVTPDATAPNVWWVGSLRPEQTTAYRVTLIEAPEQRWVSCSCAHGQKSGGGNSRCYHVAAVLTHLKTRGTDQ